MKKKYILFFIFLLFASILIAKKIEITNLSIHAGLPSNEVTCMIQDDLGFMWLGTTNGLSCYDGYRFKNYRLNNFTTLRMTSNHIQHMAKTVNGELWLVTETDVFIFNPLLESFTKVKSDNVKGKINALLVTKKGDVLLGTTEGLFKYKEASSHFIFLKQGTIRSLFEDSKGNIWVGTWKNGFFTIILSTLRTVDYIIGRKDALRVTGFAESKDGHIWISTWDDGGLYCLKEPANPSSTNYRKYQSGEGGLIPGDVMYGVLYNSEYDDLWVATANGLTLFSEPGRSDKCQHFDSSFIGGEEVWTMCLDRNNTLWFSVMGCGISKLTHKESFFRHYALSATKRTEKVVTALYEDEDSCLWIGVRKDVLLLWDKKSGKYCSYKDIDYLKGLSENSNAVQTVVKDKNTGNLWLGTRYGGIYVVEHDKSKKEVLRKVRDDLSILRTINSLTIDAKGNIWIASENGLYTINSNEEERVRSVASLNELISNKSVLTVHCNKNEVWVGTQNAGAFRISANGKITEYSIANGRISCNNVACFYTDSQSRLWLGTQGGGICCFNEKNNKFDMFDDVRMFSDDIIYSIVEDGRQNLWITTGRGLVCMNLVNKGHIMWYKQSEELQNTQFIRGTSLRLSTSEILFGGYNGIDSYMPSLHEHMDTIPSPVYVVDISVMNVPIADFIKRNDFIADALPPYTQMLTLAHNQNNIMFSFSCLSYVNPLVNRYAYRMKGIDQQWIYVDANNRNISYNNMVAGEYVFEVKACDETGIWSVPDIIKVTILPPPWFTWWAFAAYVVAGTLVVYIAARAMKRRIRLLNALKIEQIERKKSEEVNHAKLKFFTNISHELFTPISVLQCSIDHLRQEDTADIDTLGIMKINLQRLQRLLQQILEFRKVESGNLKLKVCENDIVAFIRQLCKDNFYPLIQAKQITLNFASCSASIMAYFDIDKLDKILYNLLSNALKYNYQQGVISVSVDETNEQGMRYVVLKVENTGDGIPEANLPLLFKRFYEGDYRKFKTQGTGIGLSLTKDLVDLHHGTIEVRSILKETTVFIIKLPAEREAYDADQIEDTICVPLEDGLPCLVDGAEVEKICLLLVEDDKDLLIMMSKVLSIYFDVQTAFNGMEAMEILEKNDNIELVITDYVMPLMDGLELCKSIRKHSALCYLPIVMLTAKTQIEHQLEGLQAGVDVYIPKPVEINILVTQVKTIIANRKLVVEKFRAKDDVNTGDLGLSEVDQAFLDTAIAVVEKYIEDTEFSNEVFCERMNMSKSTLYRRLKSLTGMPANEFVRSVRIKRACILLQTTGLQISEIAYMVGFSDPKYFGSIFKKEKGMSPSKYVECCANAK